MVQAASQRRGRVVDSYPGEQALDLVRASFLLLLMGPFFIIVLLQKHV